MSLDISPTQPATRVAALLTGLLEDAPRSDESGCAEPLYTAKQSKSHHEA